MNKMPYPQRMDASTPAEFHRLLDRQWYHVVNLQNVLFCLAHRSDCAVVGTREELLNVYDLLLEVTTTREVWNGLRWYELWIGQTLQKLELTINQADLETAINLNGAVRSLREYQRQMRCELSLLAGFNQDVLREALASPREAELQKQIAQVKAERGRAIADKKKLRGKAR